MEEYFHLQVGSSGQSFLTVRVPLYISRVHATSPPGWASLDHRTELSVSLYYNTLLWHRGPLTEPSLTARIQVFMIKEQYMKGHCINLSHAILTLHHKVILEYGNIREKRKQSCISYNVSLR